MDLIIDKHNKKIKCKLEVESKNGLDSLPREISLDILSRLPITSVMQSRFVSRAWHTLSLDQNLVNLHLSQAIKRNPFLIFHCDYPIRNQLYFVEFSDHDDGKGTVRKINTPFSASMPEFKVVGSCNGLLCLSGSLYNNDAVYVYNPFTRDYIELPKSRQFEKQKVICGFGFCQGTNEYKVVKIVYHWNVDIGFWPTRRMRMHGYVKSEVLVFSLGSNTWRSIGKAPYQLERRSAEALFMNERLHWLIRLRVPNNVRGQIIVSFDLADEQFHEVPRPDFGGRIYHLALLEGRLSAVVYTYGELEIWVMKEYDVKESWIKEFRIGVDLPKSLYQNLQRPLRIWKNTFYKPTAIRVLCVLKTGGILVEFKVGRLALYDPKSGILKDITFQGMPNMFQTVVHIGSLNRVVEM